LTGGSRLSAFSLASVATYAGGVWKDDRSGDRMSKIFISYSRESEAKAKSLVDDFESLGHDVWFDRELSGGQAWWDHSR
jgi:hypothetical protein